MGFWEIVTSPVTAPINAITNAYNDITGKTATEMSAEAAERNTEKQIAWERERATNAHQWEVEDLKKAGINPILSAAGSGAQTGSITPQMPDISHYKGLGNVLMSLIPTITSIQNTAADSMMKKAQAEKLTAEAGKIGTETEINQFLKNMKKYEWERYGDIIESKNSKSPYWLVQQVSKMFLEGTHSSAAKANENRAMNFYDILHPEENEKLYKIKNIDQTNYLINKGLKKASPTQKIITAIMLKALGI